MIQPALLTYRNYFFFKKCSKISYIRSYMRAHVLLNLLNEFVNYDKMGGLPSILSFLQQV